jgi:hypothetical protein
LLEYPLMISSKEKFSSVSRTKAEVDSFFL